MKSASTISDKKEDSALDLSGRGMALAFSPDQNVLAIGLEDSRILLWSTEDHRITLQIHRHSGGVLALAFSPDGTELASAGNDGRVILFQDKDSNTKKNILALSPSPLRAITDKSYLTGIRSQLVPDTW